MHKTGKEKRNDFRNRYQMHLAEGGIIMKKKVLAVLMAAAMAAGLVACGNSDAAGETAEPAAETEEEGSRRRSGRTEHGNRGCAYGSDQSGLCAL